LKNDGWTVIRIWEHDIRKSPENVVSEITKLLCRSD
jgi:very-short-patch-repair endonuclease